MKAITLHPTSASGAGTVGGYAALDNSMDSKDRRTSSSNNGGGE